MRLLGSRTMRLLAAAVMVVPLAGAAGCGTVRQPAGGEPASGEQGGFGWFAPAGGLNPVDALALAGLHLPSEAKVTQTATAALDEHSTAYLFVFEVDRATALAFCDQSGLDGARRVPAIPPQARLSMGDVAVTQGSLWCEGTAPQNPDWSRYVLIDQGSPATVHLAVHQGAQPSTA